jgi:FlaA1/EpsC-like NDP-sugar epimerase
VLHVAALFNNPEASRVNIRVNIEGTKNVMDAAVKQGVSDSLQYGWCSDRARVPPIQRAPLLSGDRG